MVTQPGAAPAWYPDPGGTGGLRYWDGRAWTGYWAARPGAPGTYPPDVHPPPGAAPGGYGGGGYGPGGYGGGGYGGGGYGTPGYGPHYQYGTPWGAPPWKGARLGRPARGPGALAEPGRRLGARALDWLLMVPVFAVLLWVALLIFAPRFGPIFPSVVNLGNDVPQPTPFPGFVWLELTVFVCLVLTGLVMLAYETVGVARYGRTFGMAWLHIRPVRADGAVVGWGRAFVRALIFWLAGILGWVGLLDPLWCLWDGERQCLHDKAADTIVINDPTP